MKKFSLKNKPAIRLTCLGSMRYGRSGQIAIEYILLLIVGVVIWLALVNGLVSRNQESPGLVTRRWNEIINLIGTDKIEN